MKTRFEKTQAIRPLFTFGTIDCCLETMTEAWPAMKHIFSRGGVHSSADNTTGGTRLSPRLLDQSPVDLLVIERGHFFKPDSLSARDPRTKWEKLLDGTRLDNWPKVLIESWTEKAITWTEGPMSKGTRVRWTKRGYSSRFQRVDATSIGGAVEQRRLLIVRIFKGLESRWMWNIQDEEDQKRPMSNLLTPPGLVAHKHYRSPPAGTTPRDARTDSMPDISGAWISTDKGTRRLLPEELARGLGVQKSKIRSDLSSRQLQATTSVFHWEYLGSSLAFPAVLQSTVRVDTGDGTPAEFSTVLDDWATRDRHPPPEGKAFPIDWKPPDLRIGGEWYNQRVSHLKWAASFYGDQRDMLVQDGLEILTRHRGNYDENGPTPTTLQLIWWEFPPEHWDNIRDGSPMNFMTPPADVIHPNSAMDEEQIAVSGEFVDELFDLGVVAMPPEDRPIRSNGPLFCVGKPGQFGQWRIISNMKDGGQNEHIASDPVYLNRTSHILEQMYEGGYTAVVDASKYFYQFRTHPDDRPWLGILHPVTQALLEYIGLPMGAGNSPGLACRYGLSFLRLLKQKFDVFSGKGEANCWWTSFEYDRYDPCLGHGYVLRRKNGQPAVRIWAHVDDFAIHGPDLASTQEALRLFLDLSVEIGMLCHPGKLYPPNQIQHYTGFIFDTRGVPTLRIPTAKRERALAMVDYLLSHSGELSRLALSVVSGTLESLIEATPSRIGHTYLRSFHSLVHPPGYEVGASVYYTRCRIDDATREELRWWHSLLHHDVGRPARARRSATLIPTYGDGSGTGTGGTLGLPDAPLQTWMGQWTPTVYHFSSNWKELKTLHLTLLQLCRGNLDAIRDTTIFYFTDNSTTYWISANGSSKSPGLHTLIRAIRLLELDLCISLQVVHVPGLVIIEQGTDGLSRGVWFSPLHRVRDQQRLTAAVFAPLAFDSHLVTYTLGVFGLHGPWRYQDWSAPWDARSLFDQFTVWFPPPELGRQAIIFTLESWVERPLTTSALFFIPRTLTHSWTSLSRHLVELGTWKPTDVDLACPPILPIPFVILYLAPHQRILKHHSDRLESHSISRHQQWHERQATLMRGLPTTSLYPTM